MRDDEWALHYEMPPLKIMQIRLAGLSGIDPTHGRRAALEIEMDGRAGNSTRQGEPPALGFADCQAARPRRDLPNGADSTILPYFASRPNA